MRWQLEKHKAHKYLQAFLWSQLGLSVICDLDSQSHTGPSSKRVRNVFTANSAFQPLMQGVYVLKGSPALQLALCGLVGYFLCPFVRPFECYQARNVWTVFEAVKE